MYCFSCHHEFQVTQTRKSARMMCCPICSAQLIPAFDLSQLQGVLMRIAWDGGVDALGDSRFLLTSFARLAPHMAREKLMLSGLTACDGHRILLESADLDEIAKSYVVESVIHLMVQKGFFSQSAAAKICQAFMQAASLLFSDPLMEQDAEVLLSTGLTHYHGLTSDNAWIPINIRKGLRYIHAAADQGNPHAQRIIAARFRGGMDRYPQDSRMAAFYLGMAVDQGDSEAMMELAYLYGAGDGVNQDTDKYFELMEQSANADCALAQYTLGCMYADDRQRDPDRKKARFWLEKAAMQTQAPDACEWAQIELAKLSN